MRAFALKASVPILLTRADKVKTRSTDEVKTRSEQTESGAFLAD
jgi:hypothetical protein